MSLLREMNGFERIFDLMFGGRNMKCRKVDVVLAGILHPDWSDDKIADELFCSVKTVRKWRPLVKPGVGVASKLKDGTSFSVRAKQWRH